MGMGFGGFGPDPEKVFEATEDIKKAFNKAAWADTGEARPLFEAMRDSMTRMLDIEGYAEEEGQPDPLKILRHAFAGAQEIKQKMQEVAIAARTNPAAEAALNELNQDMRAAFIKLTGIDPDKMARDFGRTAPRPNTPRPRRPELSPRPPLTPPPQLKPHKPKKPGSGDFDL